MRVFFCNIFRIYRHTAVSMKSDLQTSQEVHNFKRLKFYSMKFLAILLLMMPLVSMGQTVKSYEQAMEKFKKFYNTGQGDKINAMFEDDQSHFKLTHPLWTNASAAETLNKYGKLESFKFVGVDKVDPNKVYVFQTVFSKKGELTTSLTLNKNNELGTFRFNATSDEITRLLKNTEHRR